MKVYAFDPHVTPQAIGEYAKRAEALGFDGLSVPEGAHDSFLSAQIALASTSRMKVITAVAIAFPRSPMIVASLAWDLQAMSGGRFELGLGAQVKGNIERRFSTRWFAPVPRMREYVQSIRAIWKSWQTGEQLNYRGEHYTFTLMQPVFNPGPIDHPNIPIFTAGVGPDMTRLAGEVSDGLLTHPTNSNPRYLTEVTIPRLKAGADKAGRSLADVELESGGFILVGETVEEIAVVREANRKDMAFLYSTPAYWGTLQLFGWGSVGQRLRDLTREARWDEMTAEITDEMIDTLTTSGTYAEIPSKIKAKFGGIVQRITFRLSQDPSHDAAITKMVKTLKS